MSAKLDPLLGLLQKRGIAVTKANLLFALKVEAFIHTLSDAEREQLVDEIEKKIEKLAREQKS